MSAAVEQPDEMAAALWFRTETFTNGVGGWWMTARDLETGNLAKMNGGRGDSKPKARRALFDVLLCQRGRPRIRALRSVPRGTLKA